MSEVYLYDYNLTPMAEVQCRSECGWVLNTPLGEPGSATIWLSVAEPKLSEALLRYGNILYIADTPVGDWAGVLVGQEWTQAEVALNATAAEIVLDDRCPRSQHGDRLEGPPGTMFRQALAFGSQTAPTGIVDGDIEEGGASHHMHIKTRDVLSVIRKLQTSYGCEWGIAPSLGGDKRPVLSAWWKARAGTDHSGRVALEEGLNLAFADTPVVVVEGRVKNSVFDLGQAETAAASIPSDLETDPESINRYGLREVVLTEDVTNPASLTARAYAALQRRKQPSRTFTLVANNPAIYPYLRIGNTLRLILHTVGIDWHTGRRGIDTTVRIVGMTYNDAEGVVPLKVEEVV
jgi:hypothetical protein